MVKTEEILKAMTVTTITARQRITDKITTGVTSDVTSGDSSVTSGVAIETITLIIEIMVFTGVSIATDHIDIDAMIADS